jgi:hypothetical protein
MQRRDLNAPDAYFPVAAYTQAIEVSGVTRTLYIRAFSFPIESERDSRIGLVLIHASGRRRRLAMHGQILVG